MPLAYTHKVLFQDPYWYHTANRSSAAALASLASYRGSAVSTNMSLCISHKSSARKRNVATDLGQNLDLNFRIA